MQESACAALAQLALKQPAARPSFAEARALDAVLPALLAHEVNLVGASKDHETCLVVPCVLFSVFHQTVPQSRVEVGIRASGAFRSCTASAQRSAPRSAAEMGAQPAPRRLREPRDDHLGLITTIHHD